MNLQHATQRVIGISRIRLQLTGNLGAYHGQYQDTVDR